MGVVVGDRSEVDKDDAFLISDQEGEKEIPKKTMSSVFKRGFLMLIGLLIFLVTVSINKIYAFALPSNIVVCRS